MLANAAEHASYERCAGWDQDQALEEWLLCVLVHALSLLACIQISETTSLYWCPRITLLPTTMSECQGTRCRLSDALLQTYWIACFSLVAKPRTSMSRNRPKWHLSLDSIFHLTRRENNFSHWHNSSAWYSQMAQSTKLSILHLSVEWGSVCTFGETRKIRI